MAQGARHCGPIGLLMTYMRGRDDWQDGWHALIDCLVMAGTTLDHIARNRRKKEKADVRFVAPKTRASPGPPPVPIDPMIAWPFQHLRDHPLPPETPPVVKRPTSTTTLTLEN